MEKSLILSEAKAAKLLGITAPTLSALRKKGLGPRYTQYPSSIVRYNINDITSFIKECTYEGCFEKRND